MTYPGGKHGLIRMRDTGRHYYETVLRFFEREQLLHEHRAFVLRCNRLEH